MKSRKCPKCETSNIYFKEYALDNVTLDGKSVAYVDYVCTDKEALSKIPKRAEKMGDWKRAK